MNKSKQNGYGLIEIIITVAIGMMVFLGVSEYLNSFLRASLKNINTTEALFFAKSSLEQARAVRDEDWANISSLNPGDSYSFDSNGVSPEKWIAQLGTRSEGKYTMWIIVSEVQRDGNDNIVPVGGPDENTFKITSNVSWPTASGTEQISLFEYLTNFR
jgi:type II secretory pathway pseudopilin PulG